MGVEENHLNTKNAPHRARFLCSVGVLREGGGGGMAGEEGVCVSMYINVITKKTFCGDRHNSPSPPSSLSHAHFSLSANQGRVWGCQRESGETAGEGREDVSKLIYCLNIKKKEPFMGMGTTAHPHPCRCHACAGIPPGLPPSRLRLPGSCRRVQRPFPRTGRQRGVLVTPCGVVDVPFGVVDVPFGVVDMPFGVVDMPFGVVVVVEVLGDGGRRGTWS